MANSQKSLRDLINVLAAHWGKEAILEALSAVDDRVQDRVLATGKSVLKRRSRKPRPTEIVRRYQLPDKVRREVNELALLYEGKAFLPTIADVKNFLEFRGKSIDAVKNRDQAFVKVLEVILSMSREAVNDLRNSSAHGVPLRLGPLSDAIGAASGELRSRA